MSVKTRIGYAAPQVTGALFDSIHSLDRDSLLDALAKEAAPPSCLFRPRHPSLHLNVLTEIADTRIPTPSRVSRTLLNTKLSSVASSPRCLRTRPIR